MKKTELFDGEMNRYAFDFEHCRLNDGWSQLDTEQDFSHYGNWAHPERLHVVSFVEGDITVSKCEDEDEFVAEIEKLAMFHITTNSGRFSIDPGNNSKHSWKALGLAGYLH